MRSAVRPLLFFVLIVGVPALGGKALAQEEQAAPVQRYKTPEERRETGRKHVLTDAVNFRGLLEFEAEVERFNLADGGHSDSTESPLSIQGGLEASPAYWLKAELVYEFDFVEDKHAVDEALSTLEINDWELELGKLYLPFGEYFSNFTTGPLIETAESRGLAAVLSYEYEDGLTLSPFLFYGWSQERSWIDDELQWGVALELGSHESFKAGASYISHLSGSSSEIAQLDAQDRAKEVSAINSFVALEIADYALSFEYFSALRGFAGEEEGRLRPRGWNFEVSRLLNDALTLSLRFEGADDLTDEPFRRGGIGLNFVINERSIISLDLLRASYRRGFAEDQNGEEIEHSHAVVGQLSIEL